MPCPSRIRARSDAATRAKMSIVVTTMFPETRPPEVKSIRSPHPRAQVIGFVLCVGFASTAYGFEVKHRLPLLLQEQSVRMSTVKR